MSPAGGQSPAALERSRTTIPSLLLAHLRQAPGALPSQVCARRSRRARWEESVSGGKAEPLGRLKESVVSPGKPLIQESADPELLTARGGPSEAGRSYAEKRVERPLGRVEPGGAIGSGSRCVLLGRSFGARSLGFWSPQVRPAWLVKSSCARRTGRG